MLLCCSGWLLECCYLDVAREYLVVARMLLWCSGWLIECGYFILLLGCC